MGNVGSKPILRYSMAFKRHIVSEIESGALSMFEAKRIYNINGGPTVKRWIQQFGKNHLLAKVVRVEKPEERNRIKELEERNRELESALANSQIKILTMETLIEVVEKEYKVDLKKNFGSKQLKSLGKKQKKRT